MGYTLHFSGSSPIQNPLSWYISDQVQSKFAWTELDYESSGLSQSIPYSGGVHLHVRTCAPLFHKSFVCCCSVTAGPIVFKFGVLIRGH